MINITAADVNKLRQMTGAGMMDCKKALQETEGDFDKAIDYLRKKGQKVAEKRADRDANEGIVLAKTTNDKTFGAVVMLNCETDFVGKTEEFKQFGKDIIDLGVQYKSKSIEELTVLKIGTITIGEKLNEMLGKTGEKIQVAHFEFIEEVHGAEHSLEVQVPFLQRVLGKFKIVPMVLGTTDIEQCRAMAEEIYDCLKDEARKIIVVISTDLSHYHSYEAAKKLDNIFMDSLKKFDEKGIYDTLNGGKAEACGQGPVLTGCSLCRKLGANRVEILKYANSGDTAGPKDQVVGYLAAALVK